MNDLKNQYEGRVAWWQGDEGQDRSDGMGSLAIINDPTGAMFGLSKPEILTTEPDLPAPRCSSIITLMQAGSAVRAFFPQRGARSSGTDVSVARGSSWTRLLASSDFGSGLLVDFEGLLRLPQLRVKRTCRGRHRHSVAFDQRDLGRSSS